MGADVKTAHRRSALRGVQPDQSYPHDRLEGLSTALAGFCAGFLGRQDCVWIAEAGMTATCVDTDGERLAAMKTLYPVDWVFARRDVYEYAAGCYAFGYEYDLVSLDPPTGQFDLCAEALPLWTALARRLVVIGTGHDTIVWSPDGWTVTDRRKRSDYKGGVYWTTLEPV